MSILKVVFNNGHQDYSIEVEEPMLGDIVILDFDGNFLIQCEYRDDTFYPTGNAMDGGGNPLNKAFYQQSSILVSDKE